MSLFFDLSFSFLLVTAYRHFVASEIVLSEGAISINFFLAAVFFSRSCISRPVMWLSFLGLVGTLSSMLEMILDRGVGVGSL